VNKRTPAVAGRFYPGDREGCARALAELTAELKQGAAVGAIVPHAGWIYSGRTAAKGLAAIADGGAETIILFGAAHRRTGQIGSVYVGGAWETPVGDIEIDTEVAESIAGLTGFLADTDAHSHEHSIEVQLPILRHLMPNARIVPVMMLPVEDSTAMGRQAAEVAAKMGRRVAFVGSTDLTHYGPAFAFEPAGPGPAGLRWAKEENDRRVISLISRLNAAGVIAEAAAHHNACGAGAVAATIGASMAAGATHYEEIEHITSAESSAGRGADGRNAVGYEAGAFLRADQQSCFT